jgi:hypothetical protein
VEASAKRILTIELQRERHRIFRSTAERAATKNQLAAIRKRNRLLVLQVKRHTHQLQQSIARKEITKAQFLSDTEENSTLSRKNLLQREHLLRVMALRDKPRREQQNSYVEFQRYSEGLHRRRRLTCRPPCS